MRCVEYKPEHLESFIENMRERDNSAMRLHGGEMPLRELFAYMTKFCLSQTFVTDTGKVAAIWIVHEKWKGVHEVHAYTTKEVDKNVKDFYLACLRCLDVLHETTECHRVEAAVNCDYPESVSWLKKLGFEIEGTLRKYSIDQADHFLMAKVW